MCKEQNLASGCTGPSDCSASSIYAIMASKMKSIKGQWNDFDLYVATHDDLWYIANLISQQNAPTDLPTVAGMVRRDVGKILAKHQPCGCVVCTCEDDVQCHGCGAKHCGTHPVGEIPNPLFANAESEASQ
jgi:hypothetical protein